MAKAAATPSGMLAGLLGPVQPGKTEYRKTFLLGLGVFGLYMLLRSHSGSAAPGQTAVVPATSVVRVPVDHWIKAPPAPDPDPTKKTKPDPDPTTSGGGYHTGGSDPIGGTVTGGGAAYESAANFGAGDGSMHGDHFTPAPWLDVDAGVLG